MANFNFQGKIIRQFWGKIIRQSTVKLMRKLCSQFVTWGGCLNCLNGSLSINNTFFRCVIRTG